MSTIDQLKSVIEILPIPQEKKELFINSGDAMLNFRNFIADKYGITPSEADAKISKDLNPDNDTEVNIEELSEKNRLYAEIEGYENCEQLKQSIIDFYDCIKSLKP